MAMMARRPLVARRVITMSSCSDPGATSSTPSGSVTLWPLTTGFYGELRSPEREVPPLHIPWSRNVSTHAQGRGASTVKAIVETAASVLSRATSVTSTCSTKPDRPRRTMWASARAGPMTTGDRK